MGTDPSARVKTYSFLKKRKEIFKKKFHFLNLRKILIAFLIMTGIFFGALFILVISVLKDIPDIPTHFDNPKSTIIYDREGSPLYSIHGEENRFEIPLSDIPKNVINATIAIEDDRFFEHGGFDIGGIVKGFFAEYLGIGKRRGGSTITQQFVKNTILTSERTLTRKIKEIIIAIQLERTYSKNEILSMYLNTIPYGSNAYGIEMAARVYFDKHAKDLSLGEAAILASLPQAPSRFNPYGNGKNELMGTFDAEGNYQPGRKDVVLRRMVELGYITEAERQKAFEAAATITFKKAKEDIKHPHFVLYVKELLENKFGKEAVETGGLQVFTTLDPKIQAKAEATISERIKTYPEKYGATNAGLLSVDLQKGQILAMVGSSDYFNEEIDGNVNMVFRSRQPGSSFKPMVYATAFAKGYAPATVIYDLETDFGNKYIPQNYDGKFHGPISARRALDNSYNIPAIKMAFLAGVDNVITQAKKMGLTDLKDSEQYGTSIGIGTGEATLYQMVSAFSVFAKGGKKIDFTPLLRIESADGKIIENSEDRVPEETEVLDPQIAYTMNHVLSDKSARAPFWNTYLTMPDQIAAAKTGTSNKRLKEGKDKDAIKPLDNWTIGYTARVATGVWVGNNDASPLKFGSDGISTAAPIWQAVMMEATKNFDLEEFPKPTGIVWKEVSRWSGLLPSTHTPKEDIIPELFTTFNTPTEEDTTFQSVTVDRVSKKLPTADTPKNAIVEALVANFHSENPTNPDWEKPVQEWASAYLALLPPEKIILAAVPTENDDLHNALEAGKKPTISFVSPQDQGGVTPGTIDVSVKIDAPHGITFVEYFLDNRLVKKSTLAPYTEKIRITKRDRDHDGKHRIEARVTDNLYYQSSIAITVSVQDTADTTPPETRIVVPQEGASFPAAATITVETATTDNVSVSGVEFFLDDRSLGEVFRTPYVFTFTLPDEVAPHTIHVIARDSAGLKSRHSVTIRIQDKAKTAALSTAFLFPKKDSVMKLGENLDFFFQISAKDLAKAVSVKVVARLASAHIERVIYQLGVEKKLTQDHSFSWKPELPGDYRLSIDVTDDQGKVKKSEELTMKVE